MLQRRADVVFVDGTKECALCHTLKPRSEFYRNAGWIDGLHPYCKPCLLAYQRVRYQRMPRLTARRWATTLGVNDSFFHDIDDDTKAYLLGLYAADGNVIAQERWNRLSLELAIRDCELLEFARECLSPRAPIRVRVRGDSTMGLLAISSRRLKSDLIAHGITPRKSLTFSWPVGVPQRLERSFLLGYFDGDGFTTSWMVRGKRYWRWGLIGTATFLSRARDVIARETGVICCEPRQKDGGKIAQIFKAGRGAVEIDRWLHAGTAFGLARKRTTDEAAVARSDLRAMRRH